MKIKRLKASDRLTLKLINSMIDRLNLLSNIRARNGVSAHLTSGGVSIRGINRAKRGVVRFGQVAENPVAKDNIKVSLYDASGALATSGAEYNIDCYALICNGTRLDMANPRLASGQDVVVSQGDIGDGVRWYFDFNFNGTEDYSV